jgi:hypothetical protein
VLVRAAVAQSGAAALRHTGHRLRADPELRRLAAAVDASGGAGAVGGGDLGAADSAGDALAALGGGMPSAGGT